MKLDPDVLPLPRPPAARFHRRRHVRGLFLAPVPLRRFIAAAERLHAGDRLPDADTIASTARVLLVRYPGFRHAPPVQLRLRCMAALQSMCREPGWVLQPSTLERITVIRDYAVGAERLVPDPVPVIGGLDDALLVEMAWPAVSSEVVDYLDYRRARVERARQLGMHPDRVHLTHGEWLRSRQEEMAWRRHQRNHGLTHYTTTPAPPRFRVY